MSVSYYRQQLVQIRKKIADLQGDKSSALAKVAEANKKAHLAEVAATKATSASSISSKMREAERFHKDAASLLKKVADLEKKLGDEHKRLVDAENKLVREEESERKKRAEEMKRAERKSLDEQRRQAREHERRMREIDASLAHHDSLHAETAARLEKLNCLPEKIVVAFFASDPGSTSGNRLLLDEEVRSIQQNIRMSEHRDAVKLESKWAVRPKDILQAFNELKPTVVHFSGHGSDMDELVLQDDQGNPKYVSKDAIVQTMSLLSDSVKLVFFNTCFSYNQAMACVQHVHAAIGMNTSIGDDAARVFAAQFYSAIGFGLSIPAAFKQAKAALMLEGIPEESTPELYLRDGVEEDELILVRPAGNA